MRRSLVTVLLLLLALPATAQFYTQGSEPAGLRWRQITTPDYRVVYPEGLDSLARVYADILERVKRPVGATAGYIPNQEYKRPLPVVLHPYTAHSNGMVADAPRRMSLYTTPDFDPHDASDWPLHLVTHESRHVAQMQYVNARPYRPFNYIVGNLFSGALSSLYCGPSFFEGDAVAAETELTLSGRGRSASFLEYQRAAFLAGDTRNFWQWRFGSIKNYTPDYYTVGYIRAAGMRSVYGAQDFTARYYERLFRKKGWPWPLFNYDKTVREVSGKKFKDAFAEITDTLQTRWRRDECARAPFMPAEQITHAGRRYLQYSSPCGLNGSLYAVRSGLERSPELVRIAPDGTAEVISQFSSSTGPLQASEALGRLYWSEIINDHRWEMITYSEIWYCGADGRHRRLTHRTRWYNPSVSPEGLRLAVTEYPAEGGSALIVIDARTGEVLSRYDAPDGLQILESAWLGEDIFVTAISPSGSGIYDATGGFSLRLACGNSNIKDIQELDGSILFSSDISGVNELYRIDGTAASRLTNMPQGSHEHVFCGGGLYYSTPGDKGKFLYRTPLDSLPEPVREDFRTPHRYELAADLQAPLPIDRDSVIVIPEPQKYSRLKHLFNFHSWAPIYVSPDAVSELSFENIFSSVSLGATAFFQNELETLYGTVAYGAFWDDKGNWSHQVESKFTYSGLYPKIEASVALNTDPASLYYLQMSYANFSRQLGFARSDVAGVPSLDAYVKMYIPFGFSSGGWYRGVIPQVQAAVSNSLVTHGGLAPMNRLSASIRGYVIGSTPPSAIYPRLGAGLEAGWSGRIGASDIFSPNAYVFGYGYLPGIMRTHGVKLTATAQMPLGKAYFNDRFVSVLPRGMATFSSLASEVNCYGFQSRATLDYAFPFLPVDWSALSPVAYVRNFECTLHADGAYFTKVSAGYSLPASRALASVGADLCVVLGNLAWAPFVTRIGVSAYWNFGAPADCKPYHIGMVFNMDI